MKRKLEESAESGAEPTESEKKEVDHLDDEAVC